ncbi:MAG TPA: chemotaxis protein CheW [Blastocatellia bacterium]|nr:chemotaxis protein CheW [Blastocatellia bacterium]
MSNVVADTATRQSVPLQPETKNRQDVGGKFLSFFLGTEGYGLEILKVHEIIGLLPITRVPRTPEFIRGVINLRGKVIPVVDLRLKFGLPSIEYTDKTCIIVVEVGHIEMGIIVDRVSEVLNIASHEIEDAPSFGISVNTDFIHGLGKSGQRVTILLDISKVLTTEETSALTAMSGELN